MAIEENKNVIEIMLREGMLTTYDQDNNNDDYPTRSEETYPAYWEPPEVIEIFPDASPGKTPGAPELGSSKPGVQRIPGMTAY